MSLDQPKVRVLWTSLQRAAAFCDRVSTWADTARTFATPTARVLRFVEQFSHASDLFSDPARAGAEIGRLIEGVITAWKAATSTVSSPGTPPTGEVINPPSYQP